jgi:4-hydroxy-tetrahydrodipicolinate reductase
VIRAGVIGAGGRMGSEACRAIENDPELELVARVGREDPLSALTDAGAEVAVELSTPASVKANVRFCLTHGIHCVIGATGLTDEDLDEVRAWCREGRANAFVAPNFALGAVLMMSFAATAARHFDTAEIVERHHERKLDAPSGTALRTARLMGEARAGRPFATPAPSGDPSRGLSADGVRIHSLRLPGSVAHQEVVLGSAGETLTIRHDSTDRASFMPGVLLAVKKAPGLDGLVVGLERLLDL